MSLKEKDYPKFLKIAYKGKTGKKLDLRHPKTLNEKIQWLKLYDNLPIKTQLTDKILVRDYVKDKIGEDYLKPVLWTGAKFDDIPFDNLPDSFVIKANHGCKWHVIIKDKNKFLKNEFLIKSVKDRFDSWISLSFFGYSDFETQYKNIKPQIIIEPLMRENINMESKELTVWHVNSSVYTQAKGNEIYEEALNLSKALAQGFKFVRVDWMIYKNNLYFEEMTFTPLSGFLPEYLYSSDFFEEINKNFII